MLFAYAKNLRRLGTIVYFLVYLPFDSRSRDLMAGLDDLSFKRDFEADLTYAHKAIGNDHLVLKKSRRMQMAIIFCGEDVFSWLPTGFGKSACYKSLPFLLAKPFLHC